MSEPRHTRDPSYAERLERLGNTWWKRALNVQRPYRWHLRRLHLGYTLDIGCGIGRNLIHLGGAGVGIDHNPEAVARCRERGLEAYEPHDFLTSAQAQPERFDSILCAHVAEHLQYDEAKRLLSNYLPFLRREGRLVLIAPQEAGQRSDPTHVEFLNLAALHRLARELGTTPVKAYSFPFPRPVGWWFPHNESVVVARKTQNR